MESNYGSKRLYIPLMGFVNFGVKVARPVGTKDLKLAVFEDVDSARHPSCEQLDSTFLPQGWKPFVAGRVREVGRTSRSTRASSSGSRAVDHDFRTERSGDGSGACQRRTANEVGQRPRTVCAARPAQDLSTTPLSIGRSDFVRQDRLTIPAVAFVFSGAKPDQLGDLRRRRRTPVISPS